MRGDLDAREFIAFWVDGGRVVGGHERQRVEGQQGGPGPDPIGTIGRPDRLADPAIPLESLLEA